MSGRQRRRAHFQPGRCSRWWLHHSLKAFEQDLKLLGTSMVYRRSSESRSALVQLVQETGAQVRHHSLPLAETLACNQGPAPGGGVSAV